MGAVTIFLCGDVMLGRGIDQVLPHPGDLALHEPYVKTAMDYVGLAGRVSGPIPRPVSFDYVWGDALRELEKVSPDVRIVNLETSITTSESRWKTKEVHYKMNPDNVPCLTAAGIDCCTLANNHVMDWGYQGLAETLDAMDIAGIDVSGAGMDIEEARAPAALEAGDGRVLVFGLGSVSSGIPSAWGAGEGQPGVNLLKDLSSETVKTLGEQVMKTKKDGDIAIASIHWGPNWGYRVPREHIDFAHGLIDRSGIDAVYGHSSHHVKGFEVYRRKPVFYGCGDFVNDYEGIGGYEAYRGDLGLMYFFTIDTDDGTLSRLEMVPTRVRRFRVNRAAPEDVRWLESTLNREGAAFGTEVKKEDDGSIVFEK